MLVHWLTPTIPADILFGKHSKLQYHHNQFPLWFPFLTLKAKQCKCKQHPIFIVLTLTKESKGDLQPCQFDSNSFLIGIDNHATKMISNDKSHFIGPIRPTNIGVKGFGNNMVKASGKGTVKWKIEDDEGKVHVITIHNALYIPQSSLCILCPHFFPPEIGN